LQLTTAAVAADIARGGNGNFVSAAIRDVGPYIDRSEIDLYTFALNILAKSAVI